MYGTKEIFFELDKLLCSSVKLESKTKFSILGKGKFGIKLKDRLVNFISNLFYMPILHKNLLNME